MTNTGFVSIVTDLSKKMLVTAVTITFVLLKNK